MLRRRPRCRRCPWPRREEARDRIGTHQRARQDLCDQLAVVLDQTPHAHPAPPSFQLAPQAADLTAGRVGVETPLTQQRAGMALGNSLRIARCSREPSDRLAVRVDIEIAERRCFQALGDRGDRRAALERQSCIFGGNSLRSVWPSGRTPSPPAQRLHVPEQIDPALDRARFSSRRCASSCPPPGDERSARCPMRVVA